MAAHYTVGVESRQETRETAYKHLALKPNVDDSGALRVDLTQGREQHRNGRANGGCQHTDQKCFREYLN